MRSIDYELVEKDRPVEPKPLRDTVGEGDEVDDDGREMLVLLDVEPLDVELRDRAALLGGWAVLRLAGVRANARLTMPSATYEPAVRPTVRPVPVE
jgi:hypothetical protein